MTGPSVFRRTRRALFYVFIFSLAVNLLMLTAPLYMLQVFDRVLTSRSTNTLFYLTIVAVASLAMLAILEVVRGRIVIAVGTWLDRVLSQRALAVSIRATAAGSTSIQPVRDVSLLRSFLTGQGVFPFLDAPWTPVFLAIVFLLHPTLGWIAVTGALILIVLAFLNEFVTRRGNRVAGGAQAQGLMVAENAVRNADAIRAMGLEPGVVGKWHALNDLGLEAQRRTAQRSSIVSATARFVRFVLQVGLLGTGAWLVIQNELTAGAMIAGSILVSRALAPIEQSISGWRGAVAAYGAYKRLKGIKSSDDAEAMPLPRPKGRIALEGVSFAYAGQKDPLIKGVSLTLEAGEALGLIGPTASGKTTLVRLLVGILKPQFGHVRMDGADMADWSEYDRGKYVGYLPQEAQLFDATVRENIGRFSEASADAVVEAAQLAGIHEMILALPEGYETPIGGGGVTLSGGQRQRLALARALFGQPSLLVLDEPNANLDREGEEALMKALARLRQTGTTVAVVAHRPNILASVDKIAVLKEGRLDRFGPRDEILKGVTGSGPTNPSPSVASVGRE